MGKKILTCLPCLPKERRKAVHQNPNAMKPKKTKRANLENYRTIFLQIGLILTLLAILVSFEWKSEFNLEKLTSDKTIGTDITEIPPITRPEQENKKEIKPPEPIHKLEIVKNNIKIKEEPIFLPTDDEWDIPIPEFKKTEEIVEEPIYYKVEVYPKFMGKDDQAFRKYIIDNIKFPVNAQETGLTGKVQVQFLVDLDGSLSQIKILRGVHPSIDNEVLRVIENSPEWEPAIQAGRYVRAMYGIIISFELQ